MQESKHEVRNVGGNGIKSTVHPVRLTRIYPAFANNVDPDQLVSESALLAIKYLNL